MIRWMSAASILLLLTAILSAAPAKDEQAEAKAILDKAIKAFGGEEKLTKLTSYVLKMHSKTSSGQETKTEISYQVPDRKRMEVTIDLAAGRKTTMIQVVSGDHGWQSNDGRRFREIAKERIDSSKREPLDDFPMRLLPRFKGKDYKLTMLDESKIDQKTVVGVKVSRKDRSDVKLYFDKETGLLRKREYEIPPAPGTDESKPWVMEDFYEDYKEAGGIKFPSKIRELKNGKPKGTQETIELKIVEKFDEKTFAKPE